MLTSAHEETAIVNSAHIQTDTPPTRLVVKTGKLIQEIADRQKLKTAMGNLSDKDLRDVGLTEDDLMTVRNLGLSTSALELLRDARKKRLGNW
jgi:uncharacterized protein YjiS (DUF1127 family)